MEEVELPKPDSGASTLQAEAKPGKVVVVDSQVSRLALPAFHRAFSKQAFLEPGAVGRQPARDPGRGPARRSSELADEDAAAGGAALRKRLRRVRRAAGDPEAPGPPSPTFGKSKITRK